MDIGPALGMERTFAFRGKSYTLTGMSPLQMARFSTWLQMRAQANCARTMETCPPEMQGWARAQTSIVQSDIAAGVYGIGGEAYVKGSVTMEGAAQILYLAISEDDPAVTYDDCLDMIKDRFNDMARQMAAEQAAEMRDAGKS